MQDIYEMLPSQFDDYLSNPRITSQIQEEQKWIPEDAVVKILGEDNAKYFITNGELGWSMIGDLKVFDQWDVIQVRKQIIEQ